MDKVQALILNSSLLDLKAQVNKDKTSCFKLFEMKGKLWYWFGPIQDWFLTCFCLHVVDREKEEKGWSFASINIYFLDLD